MNKTVLVMEDEASIRGFVVINLKRAGYNVIEAETGEQALEILEKSNDVAVAVMDVMLPGIDGYEVCKRIRASDSNIGIIMLTARSQDFDKVTGLMTGADDYITKPFSPLELTARVDALMRRVSGQGLISDELASGIFHINTRNRRVTKNGERLELTQVEYMILKTFMENPGKAMSREELLLEVWGDEFYGDIKVVDVNMRRLRLKLEEDPANPQHIITIWGFGYKWEA